MGLLLKTHDYSPAYEVLLIEIIDQCNQLLAPFSTY